MADKEFEEFRHAFEQLPQHIKAPSNCYRLALDINLELSPNHEPEPPDISKDDRVEGGLSSYWRTNNGLNNNAIEETTLSNKCCTPTDPFCSELHVEPNAFLNKNVISTSHSSPKQLLGHHPTTKESNSEGISDKQLSKVRGALNDNLNCNDNSKIRNTSFEVNDNRPNCQSPICGSPRPKAPIPKVDMSESQYEELQSLESDYRDDEMITSYIDGDNEVEIIRENVKEEEIKSEQMEHPRTNHLNVEKEPPLPVKESVKHRSERTRRRLPEIPKKNKSCNVANILGLRTPTLAEEIQEAESGVGSRSSTPEEFSVLSARTKPILVLKCHSYLRDDSCSPESDLRLAVQDIDSGHSTQHSPDGTKSMSPHASRGTSLSWSLGMPISNIELLDATHRGLYRFVPRHSDEVEIEIGDPVYVQKEADDLWCEGVNLRSGKQGIFPAAHVTDVDYSDFDPTVPKVKKERYLLNYLGSIETLCHKGNQVLCQAVRKIARESASRAGKSNSCILEISDQGIRMVDKSPPGPNRLPCHDYFYHLKHVSFCGFHPKDSRYFGFITKHPAVQRFACHVFESLDSTRPVAEAVGRAFQRFYNKYIEAAYPTEDIYIE